jgi:hypothetical protein
MKKKLFLPLLLFVPLIFCAAQAEEGMAGRLSSISASLSAAHISLAPGARIRVTNLETGRAITLIVNRRLGADSTHIVELTVPAADAIGLKDEARVRVELVNSDGTAAASGSSRAETGAVKNRNDRETVAGQGTGLRNEPGTERTARTPVTLPPVQTQSRQEAVDEQETETGNENESGSRNFYYVNSYEGEYPGDPEDTEPLLSRESGPSGGDIVTLPPERGLPVPPPVTPPAQTRPVPPPPVTPPAQPRPV